MFGFGKTKTASFIVVDCNNNPVASSNHFNKVKHKYRREKGDTLYLAETQLTEIDEQTIQSIEEVNGDYFDLTEFCLEDL